MVGDPLVLKKPDGTPYDGTTSDDEGLAVLPNGDYLVSSETEPSIRIFGRDGVQRASLPVPARFAVAGSTPDGQATANATLEGLTITPDGREIIAAMEGALSGPDRAPDVSSVTNLSDAPTADVVGKQLVTNMIGCPTLGATAKETQTNPLLDNYEGMAITAGPVLGVAGVSLISDDNFSATRPPGC